MFKFKYLSKKQWTAFFVTYMVVCIVPFIVTLYISNSMNDKVRQSILQRDSKIYEIISKETTDMVSKTMLSAHALGELDDFHKPITPADYEFVSRVLADIQYASLKTSYLYIKSNDVVIDSTGKAYSRKVFENDMKGRVSKDVSMDTLLYSLGVQANLYEYSLLVSEELYQYSNIRLITEFDLSAYAGGSNTSKYDQYLKDMGTIFYSGSASLVVGLIIGMITIVYIGKRNFRYFSKMASKINDNSRHKASDEELMDIMEKESVQIKTKMQDSALHQNVLIQLLQGNTEWDDISSEGMLQSHDIRFISNRFVVVLFYVEDFDKLFENDSVKNPVKQIQTVEFILKNVMEELEEDNGNKGYVVHYENLSVMILSVEQEDLNVVADSIRFAQDFLKDNLGITFSAALSNIHEGLNGILDAYHEALDILEYREFLGGEQVITAPRQIESQIMYSYTAAKEQQLTSLIKNGKGFEAKKLVADLFEQNFVKNIGSLEISRCLAFDLVGTILKIADESNHSIRSNETLQNVVQWQSVEDLKEAINRFIDEMCKVEEADKGFVRIRDHVMKYIETNYSNADLSVGLIAENVGLHTSYLSTLYKENTGEGLLEVISKYRIEKAKEHIRGGRMKLEDISREVGYSNSKTFTRVFKKYEGITPAKYRDIIGNL